MKKCIMKKCIFEDECVGVVRCDECRCLKCELQYLGYLGLCDLHCFDDDDEDEEDDDVQYSPAIDGFCDLEGDDDVL